MVKWDHEGKLTSEICSLMMAENLLLRIMS
jgi:hypothetical protein